MVGGTKDLHLNLYEVSPKKCRFLSDFKAFISVEAGFCPFLSLALTPSTKQTFRLMPNKVEIPNFTCLITFLGEMILEINSEMSVQLFPFWGCQVLILGLNKPGR